MSKDANMVESMSDWSGVLSDLFRQIKDGSIGLKQMKLFLEHKNPFPDPKDIREEWEQFYWKFFRLRVDFSQVAIPADPGGFERVIFIAKGLTYDQVVKALRKHFKVYLYREDLDGDVTSIRNSDGHYAIRVRDRAEADEEHKDQSVDQLKGQKINCITLLERLILEMKYWSETQQHLDINNVTLCAGSRDSDGDVPRVDWGSAYSELCVRWYRPDNHDVKLRARQAVS